MSHPDWRRVWTDGFSQLVIEREENGTLRLAIHDIRHPGYGFEANGPVAGEIAAFIKGDQ